MAAADLSRELGELELVNFVDARRRYSSLGRVSRRWPIQVR